MGSKNDKPVTRPVVKKPINTKKAVTITEQGPRDDQSRVDGYGGHIGPQKTQFSLTLNKYADDFFESYKGIEKALGLKPIDLKVKDLKGIKKIAKVLDQLRPDVLLKRIEESALGRSINSLINLPKEFQKDAIGTLERLTKGLSIGGMNVSQAIRLGKMSYDDANKIYKAVKNNDWRSLEGIKRGIESLAKGNGPLSKILGDAVDLHAISAFLGSSIKFAAKLGDNKLVNQIKSLFKDKKTLNASLGISLYNASSRGDLDMITTIVDTISQPQAKSNYPEAVKRLLTNYRRPEFDTPNTRNETIKRLNDTLTLLDPDWCYSYFNGIRVTKLDAFRGITEDAKNLLLGLKNMGGDDFESEIMIANSYPPKDIKQLAMRFMKDITFTNRPLNYNMKV